MPEVTVLVAVHNGESYLRPAIDSVLGQTFQDLELLVVDDGSTDSSAAICQSYGDPRLRLVRLPTNRGLSEALNAGLAETRTELVARLDADDEAEPDRLTRQLAFMRRHEDVALVGGQAVAVTADGRVTGTVTRSIGGAAIRWTSLFDNPFIHPTVMFRASVVRDQLGGYRKEFDPFSQDYDLWCRVMERHAVANLPDPLIRHRVHGTSIMGLLGRPAGQAYDARFATMIRVLVTAQARRVFGPDAVTDDDGRLLSGFILGLADADVDAFLALFERLLARFRERHTDAHAVDFARTLARQFDALAFRVTPPSRRSATRVYLHALRRHPELVRQLSWPRALSSVLLGQAGRQRVGAWWRRAVSSRARH